MYCNKQLLIFLTAAALALPSGRAANTLPYTITTMPESSATYPAGRFYRDCTSQTFDPQGPFSNESVSFLGWQVGGSAETLNGAHLIYRFQITFPQSVSVSSVTVMGGGDYNSGGQSAVLRLLDQNRNVLGSLSTSGLNSQTCMNTYTLTVTNASGTTFFIDEFDYSTDERPRLRIAVQTCPVNGPCITAPSDGASPQSEFVALSGTGTPGDSLAVLIAGFPIGSVMVDSEGTWEALPYVSAFGSSVTTQVQDQTTFDLSNTITINPSPPLPLPPGPIIPYTTFLPLRHADIFVSASPTSPQLTLYGPNYTHTALYLGGDPTNGTPLIAEAVTSKEAGTYPEVRSLPFEQSTVWSEAIRVAGFRPRVPLPGATRDAIVASAKAFTSQGLPYWNLAVDFSPAITSCLVWNPILHIPLSPIIFDLAMIQLYKNTQSTQKFICSTLVWHAYLNGTNGTLDLSQPNNMSIAPGTFLGNLPCGADGTYLSQLSSNFIVPETFVTSPKLSEIF